MTITIGLLIFLIVATYYDIRYHIIPNRWNLIGCSFGLVYHSLTDGVSGLTFALLGCVLMFALSLILYFLGGIAAGDVKWFAACGSICGWGTAFFILIAAIFASALIALVLITTKKKMFSQTFPFMYAVLPAGLFVTWWVP